MPARIKYEDIKDMKPEEAYHYISKLDKPVVKNIRTRDLMNEVTLSKPAVGTKFAALSPRGVYIFFDEEGYARYVGQAKNSFYDRILVQLDTHYYKGWGWNSMLTILGCNRLRVDHDKLSEEEHDKDIEEVKKYKLLMIDVGTKEEVNAYQLNRLERRLMQTCKEMEQEQNRLLNNRVAELPYHDWDKTLDQILNA